MSTICLDFRCPLYQRGVAHLPEHHPQGERESIKSNNTYRPDPNDTHNQVDLRRISSLESQLLTALTRATVAEANETAVRLQLADALQQAKPAFPDPPAGVMEMEVPAEEEPTPPFIECGTCIKKPGAPLLCPSCLNSRTAISRLERMVAELRRSR